MKNIFTAYINKAESIRAAAMTLLFVPDEKERAILLREVIDSAKENGLTKFIAEEPALWKETYTAFNAQEKEKYDRILGLEKDSGPGAAIISDIGADYAQEIYAIPYGKFDQYNSPKATQFTDVLWLNASDAIRRINDPQLINLMIHKNKSAENPAGNIIEEIKLAEVRRAQWIKEKNLAPQVEAVYQNINPAANSGVKSIPILEKLCNDFAKIEQGTRQLIAIGVTGELLSRRIERP